jgi:hypothetical protein
MTEVVVTIDSADATSLPASLCDRLMALFKSRAGEWIDGRELAAVAGAYAWRTRVSDLRRSPYGLTIENRQRREGRFTVSEYRMAPPIAPEPEADAAA